MEERGNKTIMCSVLFLDIVEYSRKSVAGQISLKDRFNSYLSAAISGVPITDRIILDTGDGAAINFLGDIEDALKAALSLRESMLSEDASIDPPLLVRVGINLGPVRLVRDINGQPNIVGDGINVAQRVMGFADAGQILVSRSYHDAVSRLSPQYAGMFRFQGSRTDKHVRDHEVYAVGHPGEKTSELLAATVLAEEEAKPPVQILVSVKTAWNSAAAGLNGVIEGALMRFKQAGTKQRALYAGAAGVAVVLIGLLVLKPAHNGEAPVLPSADQVQAASGIQPVSAVASVAPAAPIAESKTAGTASAPAAKPATKKSVEGKVDSKNAGDQIRRPATQHKANVPEPTGTKTGSEAIKGGVESGKEAYLSISCKEGTQMFVDGAEKGKVIPAGLTVTVTPGKHKIIATSRSGVLYTKDVDLEPGKTAHIKPSFCD